MLVVSKCIRIIIFNRNSVQFWRHPEHPKENAALSSKLILWILGCWLGSTAAATFASSFGLGLCLNLKIVPLTGNIDNTTFVVVIFDLQLDSKLGRTQKSALTPCLLPQND
jgi:hypothetical protein